MGRCPYFQTKSNGFLGQILSNRIVLALVHYHALIYCHLLIGRPHGFKSTLHLFQHPTHLVQFIITCTRWIIHICWCIGDMQATCDKFIPVTSHKFDIIGHLNNGWSRDQYKQRDDNFFNPISKQIPIYTQNSSKRNGRQSHPPLVLPSFALITLEEYLLVSFTICLYSLRVQNLSNKLRG